MAKISAISSDTERCFRYNGFYREPNHFVFIGDSRIRQIFFTFQNFLKGGDFVDSNVVIDNNVVVDNVVAGNTDGTTATNEEEFKPHHDLSWSSGVWNLKLDFVWAPVVNDSAIQVISSDP